MFGGFIQLLSGGSLGGCTLFLVLQIQGVGLRKPRYRTQSSLDSRVSFSSHAKFCVFVSSARMLHIVMYVLLAPAPPPPLLVVCLQAFSVTYMRIPA